MDSWWVRGVTPLTTERISRFTGNVMFLIGNVTSRTQTSRSQLGWDWANASGHPEISQFAGNVMFPIGNVTSRTRTSRSQLGGLRRNVSDTERISRFAGNV